jgi:uncharacterized membrane protein YccC
MGALCTSLMDLPSPLRHKFNEMLAGVLLCSVVALLVSLCSPVEWLLRTVIVLVSPSFASMMVVYGRKAMPLQFVALFVMMLSSEMRRHPLQALRHGALFFAGGAGYMAYAMVVVWILQRRLKQQVLAEALYELAAYTSIKAGCYDMANALPAQMEKLVRQQSVLAERQQASRDLILRGKPAPTRRSWCRCTTPCSTCTNWSCRPTPITPAAPAFRRRPVLPLLGDLIGKAARDIESVAYAMTRGRPSRADHRLPRTSCARSTRCAALPRAKAKTSMRRRCCAPPSNKIRDTIAMIARLHAASLAPRARCRWWPAADLTPFLTQQRYSIGILLANLRWSSPTFRFALRVAMAISVGLAVEPNGCPTDARLLDRADDRRDPQAELQHDPPAPRRPPGRHADRLHADRRDPAFRAHSGRADRLPVRRHRGGADLPVHQIPLHGGRRQRAGPAADRPDGAARRQRHQRAPAGHAARHLIATFFSYVLPSWEYQNLPRLVDAVLDANRKYVDAAADLLLGAPATISATASAASASWTASRRSARRSGRMLDEPAAKQRAPDELNRFTVQNYLLVAHMAALRLLLQRYAENMPRAEVEAALERMFAEVRASLGAAPQAGAAPEGQHGPGSPQWPGWAPLQRRLRLLQQDAAQVALPLLQLCDAWTRAEARS